MALSNTGAWDGVELEWCGGGLTIGFVGDADGLDGDVDGAKVLAGGVGETLGGREGLPLSRRGVGAAEGVDVSKIGILDEIAVDTTVFGACKCVGAVEGATLSALGECKGLGEEFEVVC
jgi:hypothetical protein